MKKFLLTIAVAGFAAGVWSQVIVAGVSPANIVANYEYGVQTHEGWPGQAGDGTWSLAMDFNIPGTYVQDTLMLVEDGTPGLNAQGNPVSQEGCNTLINDLTGKIAVIYRNTCEFGIKVLNAQNAGAVAVIIVNREPVSNFNMLGGVNGINVTIPAVFISSTDGQTLVNEMQNGPVVVFIGNKIGAFSNDVGSDRGAALISRHGGAQLDAFDGFNVGIEMYNWGINAQPNVNVNATITGPGGVVYNETLGPISMNAGDTVSIFNGNPLEFPVFNLGGFGNYPNGQYTLTYEIDLGVADDSDFDNVMTSTFTVNPDVISLSTLSGGEPVATNFPSNSTTEYQSCMFYQEATTAGGEYLLDGVYFVPRADTAVNTLVGEEIFVNVYEWNDTWVDLNDPGPQTNNDWFTALDLISFSSYYPASDNETNQVAYSDFASPVTLSDGQRYLICLQTFNPAVVSFGYDNALNYDANRAISAMPVSPVHVDGTWYTGGWIGSSAPAIGLKLFVNGLNENASLSGMAFPNPANDNVTISVEASGNAVLSVTDLSGKVAMSKDLVLNNGEANINISALEAGVYIFNVLFEDGQTAQFNVAKN